MSHAGPITVSDFEPLARARMDPVSWDYHAGGAGDELTLADNRAAWNRLRLRPRVLVDVSRVDLATTAFDVTLPHPVIVAPTAAHDLAHADGELATTRGAAAAGALMTLSTISSVPLEEVAAAVPDAPRWFQLYAPFDRVACEALVRRVVDAGFSALTITVDLPQPGNRERDRRNDSAVHLGVHLPPDQPVDPDTGVVVIPSLDWEWLTWLRSICPIPLVAKGILRADDAARAVDAGCDGVWVSNHGGRQLDTSIATADALPAIVETVGGRALVVVDGGVLRGIDALKALALGADLVALGRPILWGLAADGAHGVRRVLEIMRDELALAMALSGSPDISHVTRDLIIA